jgi:hypothetical protein
MTRFEAQGLRDFFKRFHLAPCAFSLKPCADSPITKVVMANTGELSHS